MPPLKGKRWLPSKIVSGGQTGADRAGLDAAQELGFECGGYVPKGRLAEDGRVPERFPVVECDSEDYPVRTELNVAESDATLILHYGTLKGGSLLTRGLCRKRGKPELSLDLERLAEEEALLLAESFLKDHRPLVLNVAGPRESSCLGTHARSLAFLRRLLGD